MSGVVCQFRIVGSVHSSLATRVTSLRTSNKSGQGVSVSALDLVMYGEDVINPDNNLKVGALKTQVQHFVGENVAWEKVTTN